MAREATDVSLIAFEFGIDLLGHGNHHSRDVFVRIVVAREVSLNVAMVAFHAQGRAVSPHQWNDLGSWNLKNFQILRLGRSPRFSGFRRRLLCPGKANQSERE